MRPRVLIVDDSLTVRMDLNEAFEAAGFETRLCATLADARVALGESSFVLAVLDVLLPDGDGVEFLRELKTTPASAKVPVMLLSTEADVRDRIRGLQTGAEEYVGKPYDTAYVIARSQELTSRPAPDAEVAASSAILVIDDSATMRQELKSALEAAGYAVLLAESGEEGLRIAAAARPRAVIVDGNLPGIDGSTVIRRIRLDTALRRTPCILLTGSEDRGSEIRALESGADAYVRKESDPNVILARLTAILRSAGTPSAVGHAPSLMGPKKILAIDDSVTYLQQTASHLNDEGYDVILARSGEEGLELLAVQPVDCILLDLVMPGISGHETCRRIKVEQKWRDIPVIMLTAKEESDALIEGINAGADDYISKSADFDVLKARLRAQLRRKQFEDENKHIREQLLRKELEAAETRAAQQLAEVRAVLLRDLQQKNEELESFSYSVSHDLRSPLRAIDGFSRALLNDYGDKLDAKGKRNLERVCAATKQMSRLIDDLLDLSRVTRREMASGRIDMSAIACSLVENLRTLSPERDVEVVIAEGLQAWGDPSLIRAALENLLNNAWKYTSKKSQARIEFGNTTARGEPAFFISDNGAGFDMAYSKKLFGAFQRLHSASDFAGNGVGLATVQRIIRRHGGEIWGEGEVDRGAKFFFTLPQTSALAD